MSSAERATPLLLCCAEDDEVALVRVVEGLRQEGYNPELVAGVDGDAALLGRAVDEAPNQALFVLCRSRSLDRSHIRRLEGLFSARRGPDQDLLTVHLIEARPLEILPAVRERLASMSGADASVRASADSGRALMRDVIGSVDPRREELARQLHEEMVAAEALLTRRDERRSDGPRKVMARASVGASRRLDERLSEGVPAAELLEDETGEAMLGTGPAAEDPTVEIAVGEASVPYVPEDLGESNEELQLPEQSGEQPLSPAEASQPDQPVVRGASLEDSFDEVTKDELAEPITSRHDASILRPAATKSRQSGLVYAGAAGLAAVVVMAVTFMSTEPDDVAGDAELEAAVQRARARSGPPPAASSPAAANTAATANSVVAATPPAVGSASATVVTPAADPPLGVAVDAGEPADDDGTPDEARAPTPDPTPTGKPFEPLPPAPPLDQERRLIDAAIAARHVAVLGTKIVSVGDPESQTWSQARASCIRRDVGGVGGWRLPSRSELQRLRAAGLLPNAYFWSRDEAGAADEAYAMDAAGRVNVYLKVESIARAACVRRK